MKIALCTRRTLLRALAPLLGLVLVGFADGRVVRGIPSFLIVEDPLEPAAAIITLGGHLPFREMEAAKLYRDGWALQVIIVRATLSAEAAALQTLKTKKQKNGS